MKNNITKLLLMILFTSSLLSRICYGQKRVTKAAQPKWISNTPTGTFLGISDMLESEQEARNQAVKDARRQIIESLGGVIESEFVDNIVEQKGAEKYNSSYTESKVKVVSKNIISVKPVETFTEKWKKDIGMFKSKIMYKVYVLVPFSKQQHTRYMSEIITETCDIGQKNYKKALVYCKNGHFFRGVELLEEVRKNTKPLTEITGLQPDQLGQVMELHRKTDDKLKAIIASVNFAKINGGQQAKFGQPLEDELEVHIFWQDQNRKYGIPHLDVKYTVLKGSAKIDPTSKSDARGRAYCKVAKVETAGDLSIKADIYFPQDFAIDSMTTTFHIAADNRAYVQIIERNFGKSTDVNHLQNVITSKLSQAGFKLVDNTDLIFGSETDLESLTPQMLQSKLAHYELDFVILGKISAGESNKIQDGFYFAWADGVVKLVDLHDLEVLGSYQCRGKGAGNSKMNAGSKSISKTGEQLAQKLVQSLGIQN